ncbi:hypothetical protein BDV96DRAFT_280674 [Lophiotrema nucula]|uniref:Uncharacterized protein n=1 Tax=Lophiotrema nucula TaxID=690887 RepID=A0A6A5ZMR1_9PLEO|nr:hypothetical protein BDV96DRAFT_280674 [Lophiotrema nucula]
MGDSTSSPNEPFLARKHMSTTSTHPTDTYEPRPYHAHPADNDDYRRQGLESPKVALNSNLPKVELLVHLLSLGVIGILFWINWAQKYWKDFELKKSSVRNVQLKAWQLPAKLHEILMFTSLSSVVFYNMRKLLVGRNGIPFGLISAPYMTGSPSTLLKGSFRAGSTRHWRFGALIFLVCVLSVVLGPSSAILMIPSLAWYEVENAFPESSTKILFIESKETLWPTVFNASTKLSASAAAQCLGNPFDEYSNVNICPTSGYMDIIEWWASRTSTDSRNGPLFTEVYSSAQRELDIRLAPGDYDSGERIPTEAYTTVTTELTTMSLGTFYNYARRRNIGGLKDVEYPRLRISVSSPIYQPVVHVNCQMDMYGDGDRRNISFPSAQSGWADDSEYKQDPFVVEADSEILDGLPSLEPRFSWYKDTRKNAASSLLALAIVPALARNDTGDEFQTSAVTACSIDARWAASEVSYQPTNSTLVSSNVTDTITDKLDRRYHASQMSEYALSEKPLDLQLDWAAFLDANQTGTENGTSTTNKSAMAVFLALPIANIKSQGNNLATFQVPNITTSNLNGAIEEAVPMLLGVVVADSIARTVSLNTIPWLITKSTPNSDFIPLPICLAPDSTLHGEFNSNTTIYSVRLELDRYGYGYAIHNKATRFAIAALVIYAFIVCLHLIYILGAVMTRRYYGGDCWENVGDLVALSVNSPPTHRLYGTSAGVAKTGTWKNMVKVRGSGHDHLELFFAGKDHEEAGATIEVNKKYY